MIRFVVGEGFSLRLTPRGCTAVISIFQTYNMVYVDEVAGLVGVEAYGGTGFVAFVVKVITIVGILS